MAGPRDLVSSPNLFIFIFIGQTFNIWAQDRKIRKHSSEGVFEECGHVVLKLLQAKQPLLSVSLCIWCHGQHPGLTKVMCLPTSQLWELSGLFSGAWLAWDGGTGSPSVSAILKHLCTPEWLLGIGSK